VVFYAKSFELQQIYSKNIFVMLQSEEQASFAVMTWSLWKSRNNKIWNNSLESVYLIFDCNRNLLMLTCLRNPQLDVLNQLYVDTNVTLMPRFQVYIRWVLVFVLGMITILAKTEWFSPILEMDTGETHSWDF
jgi:hypothetical protein